MQTTDIVRSLATNIMLLWLLFTLVRPRYRRWTVLTALTVMVVLDFALNLFFYAEHNYTAIATLDIIFFLLVGIAAKPLFQETMMQWLFNCFTVMNVYAITVILSYYLCGLFLYPAYAVTVLRIAIFGAVILLFSKFLRPMYRQAAEHWGVYFFVAIGLFANFAWYFTSGSNIEKTLTDSIVPLLLLVLMTAVVYISIFVSLRKTMTKMALTEENMRIQSDRELTRQRLILMDETVRQMSIAQHDRRHFNNMLLSLLNRGETDKAIEFINKQSETMPQKPQMYCRNVTVNAAVSYYAELARQQGIRCRLCLDIPEKLPADELSLAMVVSNLMENAICAVSLLPEEKREIQFTAVDSGQLILKISNCYEGDISFNADGIPQSENEGHGFGCQSISDFTKKHGGTVSYETDGGVFKVVIML